MALYDVGAPVLQLDFGAALGAAKEATSGVFVYPRVSTCHGDTKLRDMGQHIRTQGKEAALIKTQC